MPYVALRDPLRLLTSFVATMTDPPSDSSSSSGSNDGSSSTTTTTATSPQQLLPYHASVSVTAETAATAATAGSGDADPADQLTTSPITDAFHLPVPTDFSDPPGPFSTNGLMEDDHLFPKPDGAGFRTYGFSRKRPYTQPAPATPVKRSCTARIALRPDDEAVAFDSPFVNVISPPSSAASTVSAPQSAPSVASSSQTGRTQQSRSFENYFRTNFTIVNKLGSGSFGDVFHVTNRANEHFAVKCSRTTYKGVKDRQRRLQEVHNLERLASHPHCVRLVQAWEQKGFLYICTELCSRGSLKQRMESMRTSDCTFTQAEMWNLLLDILLGLQHIHSYKMAHLDLKPENLLLSDDHTIKIADFGLATERQHHGQDGDSVYMAPELLKWHYSCAADIFSLGIVLLEMATLKYPPDEGEEWTQLRGGNIAIWPGYSELPEDLRELITSMLNSDPEKRPTVSDLLSRPNLASLLEERSGREETIIKSSATNFVHHCWNAVRNYVANLSSPQEITNNDEDENALVINAPYMFTGSDDSMHGYSSPGLDYDGLTVHSSPFKVRKPAEFVLTPPPSSFGDITSDDAAQPLFADAEPHQRDSANPLTEDITQRLSSPSWPRVPRFSLMDEMQPIGAEEDDNM